MPSTRWLPVFVPWLIAFAIVNEWNGTAAIKSEESAAGMNAEGCDEEESDDVTLLAMPMKTATRRVSQHRVSAGPIHQQEPTSFFQVDEEVNTVPASDMVQVEPERTVADQSIQTLETKPLDAPGATEKVGPSSVEGVSMTSVPAALDRAMMQRMFTFSLVVMIFGLAGMLLLSQNKGQGFAAASSEIRSLVRATRVRTKEEILSMFASESAEDGHTDANRLSSAGVLMRIEGKVVAKVGQAMVTPFSDRQCLMYSASACQKRQDGVHQPPLAYYAACTDFVIELADADGPLQISVHGHDASLFDMCSGRYSEEAAFSDVPESWKGFALAHLIHGADASCNALGHGGLSTKGDLEFCESSLLDGATVTCVGEVTRDRNGDLCICPWQPLIDGVDVPLASGKATGFTQAVLEKLTPSWERQKKIKTSPLAGQVFISDSPELLDMKASFWWQVARGCWRLR